MMLDSRSTLLLPTPEPSRSPTCHRPLIYSSWHYYGVRFFKHKPPDARKPGRGSHAAVSAHVFVLQPALGPRIRFTVRSIKRGAAYAACVRVAAIVEPEPGDARVGGISHKVTAGRGGATRVDVADVATCSDGGTDHRPQCLRLLSPLQQA